jgi:hypothetical protein
MNKKEIIEILQEEVGFLNVIEDENEDGELYISEAQFKEIEEIIEGLEEKKRRAEEAREALVTFLMKYVKTNPKLIIGGEVFDNVSFNDDLAVLSDKCFLMGCTMTGKTLVN